MNCLEIIPSMDNSSNNKIGNSLLSPFFSSHIHLVQHYEREIYLLLVEVEMTSLYLIGRKERVIGKSHSLHLLSELKPHTDFRF